MDIIYGYPGFELVEQEERGEIVIGGCVIDAAAPDRHCRSCQHEWRIKRRGDRSQLCPFDECVMAEQPAG